MAVLIIDGQPATIPEQRFADFHGHSVFTTLRSKDGEPMLWDLHWQRLTAHAQFFGYRVPSEDSVLEVIRKNIGASDQKIRVIIAADRYAMTLEDYLPPASGIYLGVKAIVSSLHIHPQLGRFKTGNYLPYALALKEAQENGAFEGLLTDAQGFLADGARSSLMHFDGTTLISLTGGLNGCMRTHVVKHVQELGVPVIEKALRPVDISGQLLLANSLFGVVPVDRVKYDFVVRLVETFRMEVS